MSNRLMNPANALTLSRFVSAPVMLWLLLQFKMESPHPMWISITACALLIVTIFTDLFDGLVARRMKVVTDFGKIMDPVADSTFFMTLLFALSASPRFRDHLPIWIPIIVLWREVAMHVLRRYAALRGIVLAAKASGKTKMVIQSVGMIAFFLLLATTDSGLFPIAEEHVVTVAFWLGIVIAAVNILSLIEYSREIPSLVGESAAPHNGA